MSNYYYSIASGSKGNCGLLHMHQRNFLIDLGVSHRQLKTVLATLNLTFHEIDAVFITHEHIDHVKGIQTFCKKESVPVYCTHGTAQALQYKYDLQPNRLHAFYGSQSLEMYGVAITSFLTPHDAVESVGYAFSADGCKFGYATDLGFVTTDTRRALAGCGCVVLESNHDLEMLANGPYPYPLQERIRGSHGHLSNIDCARFAIELAENGTQHFILAHLSEQNNDPLITKNQTEQALLRNQFNCTVQVAPVGVMKQPFLWSE